MRLKQQRKKPGFIPQIGMLDIRPYPVMVRKADRLLFTSIDDYDKVDGFALFLTAYDQLSGGELKQVGVERPLYGHTDRKTVEAKAQFHLARKMRRAYREKDILIQMKPE
jgi:hypothetical protein